MLGKSINSKVQFWSDYWCGNTKLQNLFPLIYVISKDKNMLIEKTFDIEKGNGWNIVVNRNLRDWEIEEYEKFLLFLDAIQLNNKES